MRLCEAYMFQNNKNERSDLMFYVYRITNTENNMCYIGQSVQELSIKLKRHIGYAMKEELKTKFHQAMRDIGADKFNIEMVESCKNQEDLDVREQYWILHYYNQGLAYNMKTSIGKSGGDTLSNHPNIKEIGLDISRKVMGGNNSQAVSIIAHDILDNVEYSFDSLADCARELGLPNHHLISKRCRGLTKSPYKGQWNFRYK